MRILIDTNVLIDFIAKREPYFSSANKIISACVENKLEGSISLHSVSDIYYILRKTTPEKDRRRFLKDICLMLEVIAVDKSKLIYAIENEEFKDFEDCLQSECAVSFNADYIITRNTKDFLLSGVKAIEPDAFLELI